MAGDEQIDEAKRSFARMASEMCKADALDDVLETKLRIRTWQSVSDALDAAVQDIVEGRRKG